MPGLVAAHPLIRDALPFDAGDELARDRVVREQMQRLARRLFHRQAFTAPDRPCDRGESIAESATK